MVKCADCGFLTLRDKETGLLVEVNDDYRVSGKVPEYILAYENFHNYPICFAMAYDLMPEVERAIVHNKNDDSKYALDVITSERICPPKRKEIGFVNYQQGFTPKEHREMIDRERQRASDKRWHLLEIVVIAIATIAAGVVGYFLRH